MKTIIIFVCIVFVFCSCNNPPQTDLPLHNTVWTLESFEKSGGAVIPVEPDETYNIQFFTDNYLSGQKDCNRYLGQYTAGNNQSLSIDSLITTEMRCSMEGKYGEAIRRAAFYHLSDDKLKLYSNTDFPVLHFYIKIGLKGVVWKLESFEKIGQSVTPVNPNQNYTIQFNNDSKVNGRAHCNLFSGKYSVGANNTISLDSLIITLMHCGPNSQMGAYMAALNEALFYKITDHSLKIFYSDSNTVLNYVADTGFYNTIWTLEAFEAKCGAIIPAPPDEKYTISFKDNLTNNNNLSGTAHCNHIFGKYTLGLKNALSVENLATTLMLCFNLTMEKAYHAAIEQTTSYQISGNQLKILTNDSLSVLNYVGE